MENQTQKKQYKSFWPIVIIIILSFFAGGSVMWIAFNSNLQENLNSIFSSYSAKTHARIEKERDQAMAEQSKQKGAMEAPEALIDK